MIFNFKTLLLFIVIIINDTFSIYGCHQSAKGSYKLEYPDDCLVMPIIAKMIIISSVILNYYCIYHIYNLYSYTTSSLPSMAFQMKAFFCSS
jgi:hypothetical protein